MSRFIASGAQLCLGVLNQHYQSSNTLEGLSADSENRYLPVLEDKGLTPLPLVFPPVLVVVKW
jgi:hypothetical protein